MDIKTILPAPTDFWSVMAFAFGAMVVVAALISLALVLFGVAATIFG